jgi:hypothetical protein
MNIRYIVVKELQELGWNISKFFACDTKMDNRILLYFLDTSVRDKGQAGAGCGGTHL